MTDEERDALLLRLEAKVDGHGVYIRAIAERLLSPAEITEIEAKFEQASPVAGD